MRTLIDAMCPGCGDVHVDVWVDTANLTLPWCHACRVPLIRHRQSAIASAVHADSFRGGYWVEHGLCNADGSRRRYDSRSEMATEARRRGLVSTVVHAPEPGTDKATETQRFL